MQPVIKARLFSLYARRRLQRAQILIKPLHNFSSQPRIRPRLPSPTALHTYFFLSFVAAFPFATPLTVLARFLRCLPTPQHVSLPSYKTLPTPHPQSHQSPRMRTMEKTYTYAAADSPSLPSSPPHTSPADNAVQTSSSPHANRTPMRTLYFCHRHTVSENRSMRLDLLRRHRVQQVCCGARLWIRWRGWGGGRRCMRGEE